MILASRNISRCFVMTLIPLALGNLATLSADEPTPLHRIATQLHDLKKQQAEINDQLKKVGDALTKELLADTPPEKKVQEARSKLRVELATKAKQLAKNFDELTQLILVLAQRMDKSNDAAARELAKLLRVAVKFSEEKGLAIHCNTIVDSLQKGSFEDFNAVRKTLAFGQVLHADLEKLVLIILADDRDAVLKRNLQLCTKLLDDVRNLTKEQKFIHDQAAGNGAKLAELRQRQFRVNEQTHALAKASVDAFPNLFENVLKVQLDAEKAFQDGKRDDALGHLQKSFKALKVVENRAALLETQLKEEIEDRNKKKPR